MSESLLDPDNAASSAPATPQEPPKYDHIRRSQRGLPLLDTYRKVCMTCRAADSRNFEENSNRGEPQTARKTPRADHHKAGFWYPRLQNCDPDGLPQLSACYSCNTLLKKDQWRR
jgi:hypothetical protein